MRNKRSFWWLQQPIRTDEMRHRNVTAWRRIRIFPLPCQMCSGSHRENILCYDSKCSHNMCIWPVKKVEHVATFKDCLRTTESAKRSSCGCANPVFRHKCSISCCGSFIVTEPSDSSHCTWPRAQKWKVNNGPQIRYSMDRWYIAYSIPTLIASFVNIDFDFSALEMWINASYAVWANETKTQLQRTYLSAGIRCEGSYFFASPIFAKEFSSFSLINLLEKWGENGILSRWFVNYKLIVATFASFIVSVWFKK